MALPELMLPPTLPDFKASDHTITPEPLYAPVERQGGTARRRRLFTSTPRLLDTQLEVDQAQLEAFYAWYEGPLQAGASSFTAKVAKVGPGVEYWEACGLTYTAEHGEGGLHLISLTAKLKGTPSDTAPASATMTAEALSGFVLSLSFGSLTAEAFGIFDLAAATGDALTAEAICSFYAEAAGVPAGVSLDAEAVAAFELFAITLGSDALTAEAVSAFDLVLSPEVSLDAEASAAFDLSLTTTLGYANPADFSVSSSGSPYKGTVRAGFRVSFDGNVYRRIDTGAYTSQGVWIVPPSVGAGAGVWVKATRAFGSDAGALLAFNTAYHDTTMTPMDWGLAQPFTEAGAGPIAITALVQIATDPDFLNVVSSFTVDLTVEYV